MKVTLRPRSPPRPPPNPTHPTTLSSARYRRTGEFRCGTGRGRFGSIFESFMIRMASNCPARKVSHSLWISGMCCVIMLSKLTMLLLSPPRVRGKRGFAYVQKVELPAWARLFSVWGSHHC